MLPRKISTLPVETYLYDDFLGQVFWGHNPDSPLKNDPEDDSTYFWTASSVNAGERDHAGGCKYCGNPHRKTGPWPLTWVK